MPHLVGTYFEPGWRSRTLVCAACEWRGDSRALQLVAHEEQSEYLCPECEDVVLVVRHPDIGQVRAAAAEGHPEAQEQLLLVEEYLRGAEPR